MRTTGHNLETIIDGLKVSYNDLGPMEAPCIIFIHGFPLDKSIWDAQLEALSNEYRVVAYDVRGHGGSDAGNVDFTIDLFVLDLRCLIQALHIDRAILCGHSMGGYIALNAVQHHPEHFEAMVLANTQCAADTAEAKEGRVKTMERILEDGVAEYAQSILPKLFSPESLTSKEKEVEKVKNIITQTTSESLCNTLFALSGRRETCSKLLEMNMPTLILVGDEDELTPPTLSYLMHSKIRGSNMALIAHSGHMPCMENPALFNEQLLNFVHHFVPAAESVKR
jgi:3-oxoadipate enol-lactonase